MTKQNVKFFRSVFFYLLITLNYLNTGSEPGSRFGSICIPVFRCTVAQFSRDNFWSVNCAVYCKTYFRSQTRWIAWSSGQSWKGRRRPIVLPCHVQILFTSYLSKFDKWSKTIIVFLGSRRSLHLFLTQLPPESRKKIKLFIFSP